MTSQPIQLGSTHGPTPIHRVAVIGNGRSVLQEKMGSAIDACNVVVRCNDCVVAGYEQFVGTRTDIHFFCDSLPSERLAVELVGRGEELVLYLVHREISDIDERLRKSCEFISFATARSISRRYRLTRRLTTGLMAICYCLDRFVYSDICLHGFDYVIGAQVPKLTHYWHEQTEKQLHTVHSIAQEAQLLKQWLQQGHVFLLRHRVAEGLPATRARRSSSPAGEGM